MHDPAFRYVAGIVAGQRYARVVEVGSRDMNGSIRELVDAGTYVGIDLEDGPGVDVVADCRYWEPPWDASLVICCEVLEHSDDPAAVVKACIGYLRPGGRLIVTCPGPGRPHSGHDGMELRDDEVYSDIDPDDLKGWMAELEAVQFEARPFYHAGIFKVWTPDYFITGIKR